MELEDLKNIWKSQTEKISSADKMDESHLFDMLHSKAGDVISRLKSSILFESYFTLGSLAVCFLIFPFISSPEIKICIVAIIVICIIYIVYYRRQIQLLKSMTAQGLNLKKELELLVENFTRYLHFYRTTYRILIPFAMLLGFVLGGQLTQDGNWMKILKSPLGLMLTAILLFGITFSIDKAISWYLNRLYGRHLTHLQFLLKELEE